VGGLDATAFELADALQSNLHNHHTPGTGQTTLQYLGTHRTPTRSSSSVIPARSIPCHLHRILPFQEAHPLVCQQDIPRAARQDGTATTHLDAQATTSKSRTLGWFKNQAHDGQLALSESASTGHSPANGRNQGRRKLAAVSQAVLNFLFPVSMYFLRLLVGLADRSAPRLARVPVCF
jgi:hypothetical protein